MKRISFILIALFLLTFTPFANAKNQNQFKKVKNEGLYGVINKSTDEIIIPSEFDKIKILKTKDKNIAFYGMYKNNKLIHIQHLNPDLNSLDKIYEENNKVSKIKFYNYPKFGNLILTKNNKFGLLSFKENKIIFIPPIYHNIYVPDNQSSVFKFLSISYADIEDIKVFDGYYWFNLDKEGKLANKRSNLLRLATCPYLDEEIKTENDNIVFNFKSLIDKYKNIELTAFPNKNRFGIGKIKFNSKNYIELNDDSIKIYQNKNIYEIPKNNYEDFYFQDSNTIIYNIKNISLSNPDRIFAKSKNEKLWGIIDKNEKIITDFQFSSVFGLGAKEDIALEKTDKKYNFDYKKVILPSNNIFLVKKEDLYSAIDINGEKLIPYFKVANEDKIFKNALKNFKNDKKLKKLF